MSRKSAQRLLNIPMPPDPNTPIHQQNVFRERQLIQHDKLLSGRRHGIGLLGTLTLSFILLLGISYYAIHHSETDDDTERQTADSVAAQLE